MSRRRQSGAARSGKGFVKRANERFHRHDAYFRRAKADGYLARSVYKLEELDEQFRLIRAGDVVLDLGCAPGSWMQYAEQKIRDRGGRLVGIDLLPVEVSFGPHVRCIQGDIYDVSVDELLPPETSDARPVHRRPFDVVLSDMAPNTTGIRSVDQVRSLALSERALEIAERLLRPGGRFCAKTFEGGQTTDFLKACRALFKTVKVRRPKSVRPGSKETYVVCLERKNPPAPPPEEAEEAS